VIRRWWGDMFWGWRVASFFVGFGWVVLSVLIAPDLAAWQLFLLAVTFWVFLKFEEIIREAGREARAERAMEHDPTLRATVDVLTRTAQELRDIERGNR
jgi:hypothetical protein